MRVACLSPQGRAAAGTVHPAYKCTPTAGRRIRSAGLRAFSNQSTSWQQDQASSPPLDWVQRLATGVVIGALAAGVVCPDAHALSPADCEEGDCNPTLASPFQGMSGNQKQKLDAMDENFKNSSTLKALLEKSEANKAKNKRDILNKYCYRQAELGVGDCGGLRFIPGMTKNGKQKTPQWLEDALGVKQPAMEGDGKTLADLLGPRPAE